MNKILVGLIILFVGIAGIVAGPVIVSKINKTVSRSIASLPEFGPKKGSIVRLVIRGHTFCTGVIVNNHQMITAAHCVIIDTPLGAFISPDPIEIRGSDNIPIGVLAYPKAVIPKLDRAVLEGEFYRFQKSKFLSDVEESVRLRKEGQTLISCGYPVGGDLYCGTMVYQKEEGFFMSVHGILIPGMSGGPTMLPDGTVVGINSAVEGDRAIIAPLFNIAVNK